MESKKTKLRYWPLWLILGLFCVPFLSAVWIYLNHGAEFPRVNKGQLLRNAPQVTAILDANKQPFLLQSHSERLKKWRLVYLSNGDCREACRQGVDKLDRIRYVLVKDRYRVQTYLASFDHNPSPLKGLPKQVWDKEKAIQYLPLSGLDEIYIIDPRGTMVMHYPVDTPSEAIFSDLKRLLSVSAIG